MSHSHKHVTHINTSQSTTYQPTPLRQPACAPPAHNHTHQTPQPTKPGYACHQPKTAPTPHTAVHTSDHEDNTPPAHHHPQTRMKTRPQPHHLPSHTHLLKRKTHLNNTRQHPIPIKTGPSNTNRHVKPGKRMTYNIKHAIQRLLDRTGRIRAIHLHILRRELKYRKPVRRNNKTPHIKPLSYQQ